METRNPSTLAPTSSFRVAALAIGYIVTLIGVLSIFSIPFYASLLLMALGTVIALLSNRYDRTKIPMTRNSWMVLIAGSGLIFGVLALFGDERIHHWRPFPAGYLPAWTFSFLAFRHVRYLISHNRRIQSAAT